MATIVNKTRFLSFPKIIAYLGFIGMLLCVIYAVMYGNFSEEGPVLVSMPWGLVALVDLYIGLILFSCWVFWREENTATAISWMLLVMILGNMISCLYLIKAVYEAEGSILKFWLGKEKAGAKHVI